MTHQPRPPQRTQIKSETRDGTRRIYFGWWVVLAMAAVMFTAFGCGIYAFVVLSTPLQHEFGWSRAATGLSVSLFWLSAALAPLFGSRIDHLNPRNLIVAGVLIEGASLMLMTLVHETWQLYALRVLMGAGKVLTVVAVPVVLSRWFVARSGLALGIAFGGGHIGGLVLAPATQMLIDAYGWRTAAVSLGVIAIGVTVPLVLIFLRFHAPADIGLLPDGRREPSPDVESAADPEVGLSIKQTLRTALFWLIAGVSVVYALGWSGVMAQVSSYLVGQGLSEGTAANALGAIGLLSVLGVLALGAAVDGWNPRVAAVVGLTFFAAGAGLLLVVAPGYVWVLPVALFLIGIPSGGLDIAWASFLRWSFGTKNYGAIFGIWYMFVLFALVVGPVIVGFSFDKTQSYEAAWIAILVVNIFGALLIAAVRIRNSLRLASTT
jgi:OFA family oxalate/formate antiporter-like MFS transporter